MEEVILINKCLFLTFAMLKHSIFIYFSFMKHSYFCGENNCVLDIPPYSKSQNWGLWLPDPDINGGSNNYLNKSMHFYKLSLLPPICQIQ